MFGCVGRERDGGKGLCVSTLCSCRVSTKISLRYLPLLPSTFLFGKMFLTESGVHQLIKLVG